MTKYKFELKMKVVSEYKKGGVSYRFLAKKYDIPSKNSIVEWVKEFEEFSSEGLLGAWHRKGYTFDFKRRVVELYQTGNYSYLDLALALGFKSTNAIQNWVKIARVAGIDALNPKEKGSTPKMIKSKGRKRNKEGKEISDSEYLEQLENENLQLRIENAYLKERRRLRLRETPQKEQRESSTASEKNLD